MTQPSRVMLALSGIAAGATGGGALAAACHWAATALAMAGRGFLGDPRNLVFLGTGLGLVLAVGLGWSLSRGIEETWRRGVVATLAAVGSFMLSMAAVPVNMLSLMVSSDLLSKIIPPGYFLVLLAVAVFAVHLARKSAGTGGTAAAT